MSMLVSSTEPKFLIETLGKSDTLPEQYGSDILFNLADGRQVGVQRKEISDLIASLRDGRLAKEIGQMVQLDVAVLIIEGRLQWNSSGFLRTSKYVSWSKIQHRGLEFSLQSKGIWTIHTETLAETSQAIVHLESYLNKTTSSLESRPGPPRSNWGKAGNREFGIHILQGFPGLGYKTAANLYDTFNGVPLRWTCDEEDLLQVPGIGPGLLDKLLSALGEP